MIILFSEVSLFFLHLFLTNTDKERKGSFISKHDVRAIISGSFSRLDTSNGMKSNIYIFYSCVYFQENQYRERLSRAFLKCIDAAFINVEGKRLRAYINRLNPFDLLNKLIKSIVYLCSSEFCVGMSYM